MRFNALFVLLIISGLCLALAQVTYDDCCLKHVKTMSHRIKKLAVKYSMQVPDGGCNIHAIIFTMRKGRVYCTDPREQWVVELMKEVDEKKDRRKDKKFTKNHHPRRPYKG